MLRVLITLALTVGLAHAGPGHGHGHHAGHDKAAALGAVLGPYLQMHKALAKDDLGKTHKWAAVMSKIAAKEHMDAVAKAAAGLAGKDLAETRTGFQAISTALIELVADHPPARKAFKVFDCEKAPGQWLQRDETPLNPYHAGELRTCGKLIPAPIAPAQPAPAHKH